jgi:hypothetical protein
MTVTVQLGNTDNKLTQQEWSSFITSVRVCLTAFNVTTHFQGGTREDAPYQNFCIVFNAKPETLPTLKHQVCMVGASFRQNSVAWTEGVTEFI